MKKMKVLSWKNMPVRYPILHTAVLWLVLEHFNAPGWTKGVAWTVMGLLWVAAVLCRVQQEEVTLDDIQKQRMQ